MAWALPQDASPVGGTPATTHKGKWQLPPADSNPGITKALADTKVPPKEEPFFTGTTGTAISAVENKVGPYVAGAAKKFGEEASQVAHDPVGAAGGLVKGALLGAIPGSAGALEGLTPEVQDKYIDDFRQEGRRKVFEARPDEMKKLGWHFTSDELQRIEDYAHSQYEKTYGHAGPSEKALMGAAAGAPSDVAGLAGAYLTGGVAPALAVGGYSLGKHLQEGDLGKPEAAGDVAFSAVLGAPLGLLGGKGEGKVAIRGRGGEVPPAQAPPSPQAPQVSEPTLAAPPTPEATGEVPGAAPSKQVSMRELAAQGKQQAIQQAPSANPIVTLIDGSKVELNRLNPGGPSYMSDGSYLAASGQILDKSAVKSVDWPKGTLRGQASRAAQAERGPQQTETPQQNITTNQVLQKPAIRFTTRQGTQRILTGNPGETHAQLIDRMPKPFGEKLRTAGGVEHGFIDASGKFVPRPQARAEVNQALPPGTPKLPTRTQGGAEPGKPHSEDLAPGLAEFFEKEPQVAPRKSPTKSSLKPVGMAFAKRRAFIGQVLGKVLDVKRTVSPEEAVETLRSNVPVQASDPFYSDLLAQYKNYPVAQDIIKKAWGTGVPREIPEPIHLALLKTPEELDALRKGLAPTTGKFAPPEGVPPQGAPPRAQVEKPKTEVKPPKSTPPPPTSREPSVVSATSHVPTPEEFKKMPVKAQLNYAQARVKANEEAGDLGSARKWAQVVEAKQRELQQVSTRTNATVQEEKLATTTKDVSKDATINRLSRELAFYDKQSPEAQAKFAPRVQERIATLRDQLRSLQEPESEVKRVEEKIEKEGSFPERAAVIQEKAVKEEAQAKQEAAPKLEEPKLELKPDIPQEKAEPGKRAIRDERTGQVFTEGDKNFDKLNSALQRNPQLATRYSIGNTSGAGNFVEGLGTFHPPTGLKGFSSGALRNPFGRGPIRSEQIDPFIKQKAIKTPDGKIIRGRDSHIFTENHYDIANKHGLGTIAEQAKVGRGERGYEQGFIGWDDKYYPEKEMEQRILDYVHSTPEGHAPGTKVNFSKPRSSLTGFSRGSILVPKSLEDAARNIRSLRKFVQNLTHPQGRSYEAARGAQLILKADGHVKAADFLKAKAFNEMSDAVSQLAEHEQLDFLDRHERGASQVSPELDEVSWALRALENGMHQQVKDFATKAGVPEKAIMPAFKDWKLGRTFKNAEQGEEAVRNWDSRKKFLGAQDFKRTNSKLDLYETIQAAQAQGKELVSKNPIELYEHAYHEFQKYMAGLEAVHAMKEEGLRVPFKKGQQVPKGWVPEPREFAQVFHKGKGKPELFKQHYIPEPLSQVIKNHLDQGLWKHDWYKTARAYSNGLNLLNLGLSGFHATMTAINASISDVGLGVSELFSGKPQGITRIARGGVPGMSAVGNAFRGFKIRGEFAREGFDGPHGDLIKAYVDTNQPWRFDRDREYWSNQTFKSFGEAMRSPGILNKVPTLGRGALAGIEYVGRPLFKHLIPNVKVGAYMDLLSHELGKLGPEASEFDRLRVAHEVGESVDNRFGMINYDNNLWNKHMQNVIHLAARAPGWYLGTAREYGGMVTDALKGKLGHKAAFAAATIPTIAMYSSFYQYAMTGTLPQQGKDWGETYRNFMHPITGRKLANGEPERLQWPSYLKELEDVKDVATHAPIVANVLGNEPDFTRASRYIASKANPLLATAEGIATNTDWRNQQIVETDPNANVAKRAMQTMEQVGKYAIQQNEPIGIQKFQQQHELEQSQGVPAQNAISTFMGLSVPKQRVVSTPFQNALRDARGKDLPRGPYTHEQIQKRNLQNIFKAQLQREYASPQPNHDKIRAISQQYIQKILPFMKPTRPSGTNPGRPAIDLATDEANKVVKSVVSPFDSDLKQASITDIVKNYGQASQEEKLKMLPEIIPQLALSKFGKLNDALKPYRSQIMHIHIEYEDFKRKGLLK